MIGDQLLVHTLRLEAQASSGYWPTRRNGEICIGFASEVSSGFGADLISDVMFVIEGMALALRLRRIAVLKDAHDG
jgi:hypothetical protein